MKNPIKWLLDRLQKKLIKSKEQRVLDLAEKLINELEMFSITAGVQSIDIWFDYDHAKTRDITVEFNNFSAKRDTGKPNKRFKS
jgi:hypothetical protein